MPDRPTQLDIEPELRIGAKELDVLQDGSHEKQTDFIQAIIAQYGAVVDISSSGLLLSDLEVRNSAGYNLLIKAGKAVDSSGNVIVIEEDITESPVDTLIAVPAGGPYIVLVTYLANNYEPGTVAVSHVPANPVGQRNKLTGTLTKYQTNCRIGQSIKINDSVQGYNETYIITQIDSDLIIWVDEYNSAGVLTQFTVAESGLRTEVVGDYESGAAAEGDQIYEYRGYAIEVRLEATGYTTGTEIVLARVTRSGASVEIVDRRDLNLLQLRPLSKADVGELSRPIPPALVRATTGILGALSIGSAHSSFRRVIDPNLFLKTTWGHHCLDANASPVFYDVGTGKYRVKDSSSGAAGWTVDFWVTAEHILIDSENQRHTIVDSGLNGEVYTLTEPAEGEFWVTPDAESYNVLLQVADAGGIIVGTAVIDIVISHASSPVKMEFTEINGRLVTGQYYTVKVCSIKNGMRSRYVTATPNPILVGSGAIPTVIPIGGLSIG